MWFDESFTNVISWAFFWWSRTSFLFWFNKLYIDKSTINETTTSNCFEIKLHSILSDVLSEFSRYGKVAVPCVINHARFCRSMEVSLKTFSNFLTIRPLHKRIDKTIYSSRRKWSQCNTCSLEISLSYERTFLLPSSKRNRRQDEIASEFKISQTWRKEPKR